GVVGAVVTAPTAHPLARIDHTRRPTPVCAQALVGTGMAIGAGIAAALYQHWFGVGNMVVWQITLMLVAASFWEFNLLLALPAAAGWWATYAILNG
ncbi:MAG: hypothetical protein M3336_04595, partial [Chloroflexota bacterium]|nr:hypothetical protein [Chloroflexota bacterium]